MDRQSGHPGTGRRELYGESAGPCAVVIFGATGDLARRKLIPALFNLVEEKLLGEKFAVLGVATREWDDARFRAHAAESLGAFEGEQVSTSLRNWLTERMHYLSGDFADPQTYQRLKEALDQIHERYGTEQNTLYYLATAPQFFAEIPRHLADVGLLAEDDDNFRRLIVEKPFGVDLPSARKLNKKLYRVLDEDQIFRIDHYLGKETVQNILAFRFANGIFEPIWNRRYIDHVQITAAEAIGVEQRGSYYDKSGVLRDMVPNHLFQLVSLTAMEPPVSMDANAVRDEQGKVFRAVQPYSQERVQADVVAGQYGRGRVDGEKAVAFREEEHVAPDSQTPTFLAMKMYIDNWRWSGVPFFLRTGKRLNRRLTEIAIRFKNPPHLLFRDTPVERLNPNWLVISLQPTEGISLSFDAKVPGAVMRLGNVGMSFCYKDYFGSEPQTGYERLLYDCMMGDATLFQRADVVETSWNVVMPILEAWKKAQPDDFPNYAAGTWGPDAADKLMSCYACYWRNDMQPRP